MLHGDSYVCMYVCMYVSNATGMQPTHFLWAQHCLHVQCTELRRARTMESPAERQR